MSAPGRVFGRGQAIDGSRSTGHTKGANKHLRKSPASEDLMVNYTRRLWWLPATGNRNATVAGLGACIATGCVPDEWYRECTTQCVFLGLIARLAIVASIVYNFRSGANDGHEQVLDGWCRDAPSLFESRPERFGAGRPR